MRISNLKEKIARENLDGFSPYGHEKYLLFDRLFRYSWNRIYDSGPCLLYDG